MSLKASTTDFKLIDYSMPSIKLWVKLKKTRAILIKKLKIGKEPWRGNLRGRLRKLLRKINSLKRNCRKRIKK